MRSVLEIIKKYPEARPVKNLRSDMFTDESRLATAQGLAEGSSRWLDPYPGTFMNYVRGKVDNDPQRFKKVSDFFRANPEKRKTMDDWYQEMGSEGWWGRSFLDDMIDEAETTAM